MAKRLYLYAVLVDNFLVSHHTKLASALKKARKETREEDFQTVSVKSYKKYRGGKTVRVCELVGKKVVCHRPKTKRRRRK